MYKHNADLKLPLIDLEADNTATGGKQEHSSVQPERLSEEDNNYCVYWIHLENEKSLNEGYIGLTTNFEMRMKAHKRSKKINHFKNAINKYNWEKLIKEIIHFNLTLEEALTLEEYYRPIQSIGWNSQKGGELGVEKDWYLIEKNKLKHSKNTSEATRKGIQENDSKEKRSLRAIESRKNNLDSYTNINKGSKNSKAILNEEQVKCIKCELLTQGIRDYKIAKLYNVKPYVINFIRKNINWKHVVCDSPAHE